MMRERVLLVDNEIRFLSSLRRQLRKTFEIDIFCDPAVALDAVEKRGPYAAIVSDLHMPHMSGIEFLRRARLLHSQTATLLLTVQPDTSEMMSAVNDGIVSLVCIKPCTPSALLRSLLASIARIRAANPVQARADEESALSHVANAVIRSLRESRRTDQQIRVLEAIVFHAHDAVLAIELGRTVAHDRVVFVNPAFSRFTQYSGTEILGASPALLCSENVDGEVAAVARASRTAEAACWDMQAKRKDGSACWAETTCIPVVDAHGRQTHAIWVWKEHGIGATPGLAPWDGSVDAARNPIYHTPREGTLVGTDRNGVVTHWSLAAEQLYGYSAREMVNTSILRLVPADRRQAELELLQQLAEGEPVAKFESVRIHKSGRLIDVLIRNAPDAGTPGDVMQANWDITQTKQLERKMAQSQKLESMGKLSAGILHEMKTPVQYVAENLAYLQEMLGDMQNLFRAQHLLISHLRNRRSTERMAGQIERFLDLNHIDRLTLEIPHVLGESIEGMKTLSELVNAMGDLANSGTKTDARADVSSSIHHAVLLSHNVWSQVAELDVKVEDNLPRVCCLSPELSQILVNLIVNASDAIAASPNQATCKGLIQISARRIDDSVELSVTDSGSGIAANVQPRVFEPFFSTKDLGNGTGLGLAIVHSLVNNHGGSVTFQTDEGHGSTFVVRLPLTTSAADDAHCQIDTHLSQNHRQLMAGAK